MDGDLLSQTDYIYENNVHEDWIKPYGKIVNGKTNAKLYDKNNNLMSTIPRQTDSNKIYLTPAQSVNYERYILNDSFLISLKQFLIDSNVNFNFSNNILSYNFSGTSSVYDHIAKIITTSHYDSFGQKLTEHIIDYDLVSTEYGYAPVKEITNEWFLSSNNCCVRKTKEIRRSNFTRQINTLYTQHVQNRQFLNNNKNDKAVSKFSLNANTSTNTAVIKTENKKEQLFNTYVYDLSGKLVVQNQVLTNQIFTLPIFKGREGAFILKAVSVDSKINLSQVILINNNNQF